MMNKNNKCKVCNLFAVKSYADETKQHINRLIKIGTPTNTLNDELNLKAEERLTDYLYAKHSDNCLVDFIVETFSTDNSNPDLDEQIPIPDKISDKTLKPDMVSFNQMSLTEKEQIFKKLLYEIYYKTLFYAAGCPKAQKDDIAMIKNLHDLVYSNHIFVGDVNLLDNQENIEKTSIQLINRVLSKGLLDEKTLVKIVEVLSSKLNILDILKQRDTDSSSYKEIPQEILLEKLQKVLSYLESASPEQQEHINNFLFK